MSDINNMELASEELVGFDPEADLYQTPTPPPDGSYLTRLEQSPQYGTDLFWKQLIGKDDHKPYFATRIVGYIYDPTGTYDNRLVFADFVSTKVFEGGSSTVAQVIKCLGYGEQLASCRTHADLMELFEQAISSQSLVRVVTQWQARGWNKDEKRETINLRGMKKFPQDEQGNYKHIVLGDDGEPVEARANIIRFLPAVVAETQAAGAA